MPENKHNKPDALGPPIPEVEDKSMCSIFYPQLARLLCPRRDLDEYNRNPKWYVRCVHGILVTYNILAVHYN